MKTEIHKHLKFTIGEQYENYEFQLSSIKEYVENEISYEVYLYTDSDETIFNQEADKILLHFNADILMKVEYVFNADCFEELKENIRHYAEPFETRVDNVVWHLDDLRIQLYYIDKLNNTRLNVWCVNMFRNQILETFRENSDLDFYTLIQKLIDEFEVREVSKNFDELCEIWENELKKSFDFNEKEKVKYDLIGNALNESIGVDTKIYIPTFPGISSQQKEESKNENKLKFEYKSNNSKPKNYHSWLVILFFLFFIFSIVRECFNSDEEENIYTKGKYCAEVEYYNPDTGKSSTYNLKILVEDEHLVKIYWSNGGWLDKSHFDAPLIYDGNANFTDDRGREFEVKIVRQDNCD